MKIVVLAGGRSTERNVSLSSSARVANALRRKGYEVALVDLFLGLEDANEVQLANLFTSEEQEVDLNISDEIDLKKLKENYPDKIVVASIMGTNEEDWEELAQLVTEAKADMIEMNLSCPQMTSHEMGSDVGTNPELVKKYCAAVKRGSDLPMMAKMTPNITDMVPAAKASMDGGADGIATINTVKSISNIDLDKKVALPIVNGKSSISGFSGKAVKPIALRFIQQLRTAAGMELLPISGIGGIETWQDAAEFILLGATTLQVTTSVMQYGYRIDR